MLGQEVEETLKKHLPTSLLYGTDREVDITDESALQHFVQDLQIDWIINCSAYTAVDKAEEEADKAYLLNETGVRNIAVIADKIQARLIHISTDYVFPGNNPRPLSEKDETDPRSVYGASKLAGEQVLIDTHSNHFIIRTSWLYGSNGNNFVYTMLKLMNSRNQINVVEDQIGTPTSAVDLAELIVKIIEQNNSQYGIYHFSNEGEISWYDFACEIYHQGRLNNLIESDCTINPCGSDQYPTAAIRPAYSLLSKEKVKATFGYVPPQWDHSLNTFLQREKDEQKTD